MTSLACELHCLLNKKERFTFPLTSLSYLRMVFISSLRKVKVLEKWTE